MIMITPVAASTPTRSSSSAWSLPCCTCVAGGASHPSRAVHASEQGGAAPTAQAVACDSFLGLAGYYRRFVEGFSLIDAPLTKLLRKGVPFDWTEKQQESFGKLKKVLTEAPVLIQPEPGKEFTVYSDASHVGLDCVLM